MAVKPTKQTDLNPNTSQSDYSQLVAKGQRGKATKSDVEKVKSGLSTDQLESKTASGRTVGQVLDDMVADGNFGDPKATAQSNAAWQQDLNDLATSAGARADGTVAGDGSVIAGMETQAAQTLPTDMAADKTLQQAFGDGSTSFAKQLMAISPALAQDFSSGKLYKTGSTTDIDFSKVQADLGANAKSADGTATNGAGAISLYRSPTDGSTILYNGNNNNATGFDKSGESQYITGGGDVANGQHYLSAGNATIFVDGGQVRSFDKTTDYDKNKKDFGADWQSK